MRRQNNSRDFYVVLIVLVLIKNKNRNHKKAKNLKYDKLLIYKQSPQDLGLCGVLFARY